MVVSGTPSVNVANTPLPVTGQVAVGGQVTATPPVATVSVGLDVSVTHHDQVTMQITPMNVSSISYWGAGDPELVLCFRWNGGNQFCTGNGNATLPPGTSFSLPLAVPVDEVSAVCANETLEGDCFFRVWLVGS
jgi:hypothetical protein